MPSYSGPQDLLEFSLRMTTIVSRVKKGAGTYEVRSEWTHEAGSGGKQLVAILKHFVH